MPAVPAAEARRPPVLYMESKLPYPIIATCGKLSHEGPTLFYHKRRTDTQLQAVGICPHS